MENRTYITFNDYLRLTGIIEVSSLGVQMPEVANRLCQKIKVANMLPQHRISKNVVTMNSRVLLKDLYNNNKLEIAIAYPEDSDIREKKVSVFSTIGVALLGQQVGDVVSWKVPQGIGRFEILEVIYQPEAVGDYYL